MPSFRKKGKVSVWVGQVKIDPQIDILRDLCGVKAYDLDLQECIVDAKKWKPQKIAKLLSQLSFPESFADDAAAAIGKFGIDSALYLICQYDFAYNPKRAIQPISSDPQFVGCFVWTNLEDD